MIGQSYKFVTRPRTALAESILVLASIAAIGGVALAAPPDAATNPTTVANPMPNAAVTAPDPSRQAFSASFSGSSAGSLSASFGTVPDGKRLVIENESVLCSVSASGVILYAYMYTNFGRTYMLLQKTGGANGFDYYAGTFTSTMYGDPTGLGTGDITFFVQSASFQGAPALQCTGGIVGHTVASPHH
jgi:hypothetical protein